MNAPHPAQAALGQQAAHSISLDCYTIYSNKRPQD